MTAAEKTITNLLCQARGETITLLGPGFSCKGWLDQVVVDGEYNWIVMFPGGYHGFKASQVRFIFDRVTTVIVR